MAENRVSSESIVSAKQTRMEGLLGKMRRFPESVWQTTLKVGREDPRRIIHSFKVGLALTLVSLLYLLEPLFEGMGQNAIWAVMTVVVVLEFTAGATLCKGVNRGLGTLTAGLLAFLIEFIADETGYVGRAIFIGVGVLLIGAASTYTRFFPKIKKNYDYGVVIFLLTFNLISVSSYRIDVLTMAYQRFYTIIIGCAICLFMSLVVFPNWSGEDLHNSTVNKLEGLARSIEACVNYYFQEPENQCIEHKLLEDPIYKDYKAVLDSKSNDETLALYASWEPRHSRHCHRYPWQQYVKLGAVLRHFGYTAVALHGCLHSEIQTPHSVRALFRDPSVRVAGKVSEVLMELADSIRNHRRCSAEKLSDQLHEALQDLNTAIKSQPRLFGGSKENEATKMLDLAAATANQKSNMDLGVSISSVKTDSLAMHERKSFKVGDQLKESEHKKLRPTLSKIAITSLEFSEALPFAAFASLLVETVARVDLVINEVEKLGKMACFKEFKLGEEIIITSERTPRKNIGNLEPEHFSGGYD
ncbi:aluminum-activated malate transporter 12-like [Telopea speciosissima]|uniref:aluminum-activated malate transporter 12-like n=1 Tax=Telopea speciosissima TaxID=54955 RepID=UPI001CC5C16C|nr:aluminum-activated malate transporter 12-like [Telopea speciosissima]